MNDLRIFQNVEFGQIRTVELNGEPWFVGKDVATALGYERATKAIQDHVDNEDKDAVPIQDSIGRMQNTPIVNESGLYALIFGSRLEAAQRFKRWVTSEVLPSLRKNGGYIVGQEQTTPEQIMAAGLKAAESIIALKNKEIERMKPKEIFADAVNASSTTILIGELAKIIKQNGVEIGQNRLFAWMRDRGYLVSRQGTDYNMPTQKAMRLGLFEIKERAINNPDGSVRITKTALVTGKGQQYFINKFLGAR